MQRLVLLTVVVLFVATTSWAASSCTVNTQKTLQATAAPGSSLNVQSTVPGNVYFQTGGTSNITFLVRVTTSQDEPDPIVLSIGHSATGLTLIVDRNTGKVSASAGRHSLVTFLLNITLATLLPSVIMINKSSLRVLFGLLLVCSLAVRVNTDESCITADVYVFVPDQFYFSSVTVTTNGNLVCPNNCSASGTCNTNNGRCTCFDGFSGDDCSVFEVRIQTSSKRSVKDEVTVRPTTLTTTQANPFRGFYNWLASDYNVISQSIAPFKDSYNRWSWATLETSQGVYDFTVIDNELTKAANNGGKFGFRVMILDSWVKGIGVPQYVYQNQGGALNCDADGNGALDTFVPNWENAFMKERVTALFAALASKYGNDKRLGWIDIGLIGDYGEWHPSSVCTNDVEASTATKQAYIDIVVNAFPSLYLTININDDVSTCYAIKKSANIGMRIDTFSQIYNWDNFRSWPIAQHRWRTAPSFAEFTSGSSAGSYDFTEAQREARDYHFSTIGNGNIPVTSSGYSSTQLADLAELGRIMGFIANVNSVRVSTLVAQNECFFVGLNMSNTGTSRIYESWNTIVELRPTCVSYLGCYADSSSSRDLSGSSMTSETLTIEDCVNTCKNQGFKYAGLQGSNQCSCGNSYGTYGTAAESECAQSCTGDETERCGGNVRNSVYDISSCTGSNFISDSTTFQTSSIIDITNVFPDVDSYFGSNSFTLPSSSVPVGLYKAYLAVVDSTGYRPPLNLAITGRDSNGRYPLGVAVLVTAASTLGVNVACGTTTPVFNQPNVAGLAFRYQQSLNEFYVFRDALAVAWQPAGKTLSGTKIWHETNFFDAASGYQISSAQAYAGSTSLLFAGVTDTWFVVDFRACPKDVSVYDSIRVAIYSDLPLTGGKIQVYSGDWSSSTPAVYMQAMDAGKWNTVTISLSQFVLSGEITMVSVALGQNAQTNNIYIDDLAFFSSTYFYVFRDDMCAGCSVSQIYSIDTTNVNSETASMKFSSVALQWFIIDMKGISVDPSLPYLHLAFWADRDITGLYIQLYSGSWSSSLPSIPLQVTAGKWNIFNIATSQFALTEAATILSVQVGQADGQTNNYYIDNLGFTNNGNLNA